MGRREIQHHGQAIVFRFTELPDLMLGATRLDRDRGLYEVYINSTKAKIVQRHTIGHELAHIFQDHFTGRLPAAERERQANKLAWEYYRRYRSNLL